MTFWRFTNRIIIIIIIYTSQHSDITHKKTSLDVNVFQHVVVLFCGKLGFRLNLNSVINFSHPSSNFMGSEKSEINTSIFGRSLF